MIIYITSISSTDITLVIELVIIMEKLLALTLPFSNLFL